MVHDLKNALGTLEDRLAAMVEAPSAEAADQAHRQCRDLRRRLVGLLLVQRGEAEGGLPAWSTDESPSELLQSIAEAPPWVQEHLSLDCRVDAGTPPSWTFDRHLVRMALEAALHNAGRYAVRQVVLSVAPDRGGLRFDVLDDGPGPDTASLHERGTGLGTALCRAVASAHQVDGRKGEVRLDARGLPRAARAAEAASAPEGAAAGPSRRPRGARFSLWLP